MGRESMKYTKPIPKDVKTEIGKPTRIYAHENYPESKYAIDFIVDIGTSVLAARDGKVSKIKSDSDKWGLNPELVKEVNFVAIDHRDGTYAEYLHLGKDKVVVSVGQDIKVGDVLGYTGLSGCMDVPHLHFNVFKIVEGKGVSMSVEFVD